MEHQSTFCFDSLQIILISNFSLNPFLSRGVTETQFGSAYSNVLSWVGSLYYSIEAPPGVSTTSLPRPSFLVLLLIIHSLNGSPQQASHPPIFQQRNPLVWLQALLRLKSPPSHQFLIHQRSLQVILLRHHQ